MVRAGGPARLRGNQFETQGVEAAPGARRAVGLWRRRRRARLGGLGAGRDGPRLRGVAFLALARWRSPKSVAIYATLSAEAYEAHIRRASRADVSAKTVDALWGRQDKSPLGV